MGPPLVDEEVKQWWETEEQVAATQIDFGSNNIENRKINLSLTDESSVDFDLDH
jgi:hypothetical protein